MRKLDLQFFGGRGASSSTGGGGGNAIKSTYTLTDYEGNDMGRLVEVGSKVFYQNSRGRISELPSETSLQDYLSRVTASGGTTHKLTQKEMKAEAEKHNTYRKEMDAFLDQADVNNKTMKQGTKANKTANKVNKRR